MHQCKRQLATGRHQCLHVTRRAAASRVKPVVRAQGFGDGPTGLNVGQYRPTSRAGWQQMQVALRAANVKMIAPQELGFALERGDVKLLDVRPAEQYVEGHIPGAFNVPFYQPIQGWSPWQVARRLGYAAFGVLQGTEPNPNFVQEVVQQVGKEDKLVVYCSLGGSLDVNVKARQTRSLIAAYMLVTEGYGSLTVLKGGYNDWLAAGREVVTPGKKDGAQERGSVEGT